MESLGGHFLVSCTPVFDEHGTLQKVIHIATDITERKQAEQVLLLSEKKFSTIFNLMPDMVGITRMADGCFIEVNAGFERWTGWKREEAIGKSSLDLGVWSHEARAEAVFITQEKGYLYEFEFMMTTKSGDQRNAMMYLLPIEIQDEKCLFFLARDITERKQAAEALRESEDKYRSLFEDSRDTIFISTYDGRFIDVNPAGVELLGYPSKESLMSVAIRDTYAYSNDRSRFLSLLSEHDYVADFVTKLQRKDGQQIEVSISASAVRDNQGKVNEIRGIIRDITEHRKIEDQLRQSQKMESIGTLAGGVAHDFNNILTAIIGYGQLAVRKMEPDNPYRKNIEHMLEAADKAAYLTQGLLSFSRKQMSNMNQVELNELLKNTEMFLLRVIGEDIEFRTNLHRRPIVISADSHQIEQILMNLATNARDAMPKGGVLTITTDEIQIDEEFSRHPGYRTPGSYGLITVSDSGMGMSEETRQRIFEPFFTTKEVGKGTGLGLAIIYGIIKQHGGYIDVYSEPGEGTTFRIYLPLIGVTGKETAKAEESTNPTGGTETILLAEDDDMLRKLSTTVLEERGYEVIEAVDGEDAISKFKDNKDRIDIFLTDLIMPKKSGKEAYDEIRKIRPDIKTIFASGYSPDIVQDRASLGKDAVIVFKPITPMDLLRKVREVLDKRNT